MRRMAGNMGKPQYKALKSELEIGEHNLKYS